MFNNYEMDMFDDITTEDIDNPTMNIESNIIKNINRLRSVEADMKKEVDDLVKETSEFFIY